MARQETVPLRRVTPATLIGKGVVERVKDNVKEQGIGLVVVDDRLTPVQQRNLEKALDAKVIDRTGLILEIFGARARTHEGRLQVELAALDYQRGRLVRSWTHLERQRGGFGFLGGPGESQIEIDGAREADRLLEVGVAIALLAVQAGGIGRQHGRDHSRPGSVLGCALAPLVSVQLVVFAQINPLRRPCRRRTAAPALPA